MLPYLGVLFLLGTAQAACFGKDASFNPTLAKPTVSQPSKNDATKVMVDWSKILKNEDCVDKYTLLVWPEGMPKTSAVRYPEEKNIKSKIVDVQPCVGYNFQVEMEEKDTLGVKTTPSGDAIFKTQALPQALSLDANRFFVTYHWDTVKSVVDLRMASIQFPRELLVGASCLDYIQVTGSQVRGRSTPPSSPTPGRGRSFSWGHLGKEPFNPNIQVGAAATLPSGITYADAAKNTAPRGPLASQWSTSSAGSASPPASPAVTAGTAVAPGQPKPPIFSPPNYANSLPRAAGGATAQVGPIRVQPPFLKPVIEILVAVEDCSEYSFEIKLFAPGAKEVGKVSNVRLAPLADIPGYVPPPLTSVMSITFNPQGKPIYGVKTNSGVTAACLPAYYEAYDAYTHRLENEIHWQYGEGNRVQSLIDTTQNKLDKSQEELLKTFGCVCTSPHIKFATTDASLIKKYADQFGHFHFQGMHGGRPFYKLMPPGSVAHSGVPGSQATSTSRPGAATTTTTTTTARPPAAGAFKPWYIFWDEKHQQWVVGDNVGDLKNVEFGTAEKSLAKCPADPPSAATWQYKSSVLGRWKPADISATCEIHL